MGNEGAEGKRKFLLFVHSAVAEIGVCELGNAHHSSSVIMWLIFVPACL